ACSGTRRRLVLRGRRRLRNLHGAVDLRLDWDPVNDLAARSLSGGDNLELLLPLPEIIEQLLRGSHSGKLGKRGIARPFHVLPLFRASTRRYALLRHSYSRWKNRIRGTKQGQSAATPLSFRHVSDQRRVPFAKQRSYCLPGLFSNSSASRKV